MLRNSKEEEVGGRSRRFYNLHHLQEVAAAADNPYFLSSIL